MKDLTPKQIKVYKIIKEFISKNGYSPTVREIVKIAGVSSPATIQEHIKNLKKKGYITYKANKSRTIRVIKEL